VLLLDASVAVHCAAAALVLACVLSVLPGSGCWDAAGWRPAGLGFALGCAEEAAAAAEPTLVLRASAGGCLPLLEDCSCPAGLLELLLLADPAAKEADAGNAYAG
jgi:hypothetical protein